MDADDETELRNPFPSPPSHYANYTTHNLELLRLLRERTSMDISSSASQNSILHDQVDVPEWSLRELDKPRVDWILEDGFYDVFGDRWYLKETIPSLAELGGRQLYPADPSADRKPALLSVLRSLLLAYSSLTGSLLAPPPSGPPDEPPDWQRYVEWINIMAQNIMAAANDLRPIQARGNLEIMMKRQLELRKEETGAIHAKCDELEERLNRIKGLNHQVATKSEDVKFGAEWTGNTSELNQEDVLNWVEELR